MNQKIVKGIIWTLSILEGSNSDFFLVLNISYFLCFWEKNISYTQYWYSLVSILIWNNWAIIIEPSVWSVLMCIFGSLFGWFVFSKKKQDHCSISPWQICWRFMLQHWSNLTPSDLKLFGWRVCNLCRSSLEPWRKSLLKANKYLVLLCQSFTTFYSLNWNTQHMINIWSRGKNLLDKSS